MLKYGMIYTNGTYNNFQISNAVAGLPEEANGAVFFIWDMTHCDYKSEFARLEASTVVVICPEITPDLVELIKQFDLPNFKYFLCGSLDFSLRNAEVNNYMSWFIEPTLMYKQLPVDLRYSEVKPYYFDALLGLKKPHRTYINDFIHTKGLGDKVIMTYFKDKPSAAAGFIMPGNFDDNLYSTVQQVMHHGIATPLSCIIPIDIYNKTAYSIVAETCAGNDFRFFTEKTCKALAARRLFIMFAGWKYLSTLRDLGFMTFNSIIDESYDEEPDHDKRYGMACEQILALCNRPQTEVLALVQPIVEHNFNHLMNTDWSHQTISAIEALR